MISLFKGDHHEKSNIPVLCHMQCQHLVAILDLYIFVDIWQCYVHVVFYNSLQYCVICEEYLYMVLSGGSVM